MKTLITSAILMFLFSVFAWAQPAEKDLVRIPLENYIKGHATVDIEYTKKAFHLVGMMMAVRDGAYTSQSFADYITSLTGRKSAADESQRKRSIEAIDVVGNAAIAKVVSDYPTVKYVDYMALLKVDGEWKIVNKTYLAETKGTPAKSDGVSEKEAVRIPLENYLKAHATGNGEYHKKAFHTDGQLIFIRDGKYTTRSFAEYIAGSSGKPAADEAQRKRWIQDIDVVGNAAVAKIVLDYPSAKLTDYMSLLKINGEWKIVNKIFTSEPKPPAKQ
ncbi:MAG TPA: nuclear transport factor 2 family protein [Pyrinomonadaceae bacterium]|nr:nuclear transport factor 2 family protein [Pyrinomonadaceae bacterium]